MTDRDKHKREPSPAGEGDPPPDGTVDGGASSSSLFGALRRRATRMAGGTLDLAMDLATASAMSGDYRLRDLLASTASPERLEAMAEAGRFLRDARETAGLSIEELAERLELSDDSVLSGVEEGRSILPLELVLRTASLLARHDPVPFLIKFLRSYNPGLEATLEQWGVMALPRNYERERRFINLYRQHDFLRDLSDEEHQRFIEYMDASTKLVVEVMQREGSAPAAGRKRRSDAGNGDAGGNAARSRPKAAGRAGRRKKAAAPRKSSSGGDTGAGEGKPVVRKVKPRNLGS